MDPHYINQIIPAPAGWVQQGSANPGDEFWYERVGQPDVQVYPGEYAGWELQAGTGEPTTHTTPAEAMAYYIG